MVRLLELTKILPYTKTQRLPWTACSVRPYKTSSFVTDPRSENTSKDSRNVAIFWDLDNKPPNSVPPYDAALRLRSVGRAFGFVIQMVAYANHHAFSFVPPRVRIERQQRKTLDILEARGIIQPEEPYVCEVCGHKFKTHVKFQKHFRQLHEREQLKRLRRLDSLKGKKKDAFRAKIVPKQEKYREAARQVLVPKVGYGLAGEIKRAGFWVITVSDKPQAADIALKKHMMDCMDKGIDCLCLVSDDTDFVDVLKVARARSLRTVVVGDNAGGLKRFADAYFSWREVANGQARSEAVSTLGLWKDDDVLRQAEWSYKPKPSKTSREEEKDDDEDFKAEELKVDDDEQLEAALDNLIGSNATESLETRRKTKPWWKLPSDSEDSCSSSSSTS